MTVGRRYGRALVASLLALASLKATTDDPTGREAPLALEPVQADEDRPTDLSLTVGKSIIIDTAFPLTRVSVGFGDIAEVSVAGPRQVLLNGKAAGVTSLIIWHEDGSRQLFDITVAASRYLTDKRVEGVQQEIAREIPAGTVKVSFENDTVFLRGTVKDLTSAERAVAIASTLGKIVNLLYVNVPRPPAQILLRVKFASVDRNVGTQLGLNILSTGAAKTIGSVTTQQFSPPGFTTVQSNSPVAATLSDALNLFFFRSDLNLGATIQALEIKGLLQILSEPNMLAENGKQASFLAGGEFPFPSVSVSWAAAFQ